MSQDLAIVTKQENIQTIVSAAPQSYQDNKLSRERCIFAGQTILDAITRQGMTDELDKQAAIYIEKARKTVKKMNERRSPVTKLFDDIRKEFTVMEAAIDPTKADTIPYKLQQYRNQYAAKKREEYEAEQRRKQLEQAKAMAKNKYATDVEDDLQRQFNALVASTCNRLIELDKSLTLENYAIVYDGVKNTSDQLSQDWFNALRPEVLMPSVLSPEEARTIAAEVKQKIQQRFKEQFTFEISTNRDDILDRLPSKRKELERIAKANKEEAERIKKQMEERERKEAEQREKERAEREAKEKAAAELAAQKQEMEGLFGAAEIQVNQYQPKTSVKKRLNVLNSEGFMQVVGMWWAQLGCTLSVAELEKIFSKQLTYCNKLANDKEHPIFIQSEHIEYVDDVKAK